MCFLTGLHASIVLNRVERTPSCRLYAADLTPHGSVPEEKEQNDDRDWNAEQPEKCASSHSCLLLCVKDNGAGSSKFLCIRTQINRDEALLL